MDERYNVARNPLGTVPNAPLASAPSKELHPPILRMLVMHGGQVNRERRKIHDNISSVCKCFFQKCQIMCQNMGGSHPTEDTWVHIDMPFLQKN